MAGVILMPLSLGVGAARAAWDSPGTGGAAVAASALPTGATPAVAPSGQSVTVSWAASSMAGASGATVGYHVRRYDAVSGVAQSIGSACAADTTALSCTEASLSAGNWKYSVTPVYATWTGAESTKSSTVTTPPPAPTGTAATATSPFSVTVTWNAAPGATSYRVLRAPAAAGPYTTVGSPASNSYGDSGLNGSTSYFYVVEAAFNGALSPASNPASATTPPVVVINPSFEDGTLSSWTNTPAAAPNAATAVQTSFNGYVAHSGTYFAVVAPGAANQYSHLSQTISVTAGQTISGWSYFDGGDYMPYNDDGAIVIQQGGADIATVFSGSIGALGTNGKTPWTYWSYTVPASGTYTIDARVRNSTDGGQPSYFGIDDVGVQ